MRGCREGGGGGRNGGEEKQSVIHHRYNTRPPKPSCKQNYKQDEPSVLHSTANTVCWRLILNIITLRLHISWGEKMSLCDTETNTTMSQFISWFYRTKERKYWTYIHKEETNIFLWVFLWWNSVMTSEFCVGSHVKNCTGTETTWLGLEKDW